MGPRERIRGVRFKVSTNRLAVAAIVVTVSLGLAQLLNETTGSNALVIGWLGLGLIALVMSFVGFKDMSSVTTNHGKQREPSEVPADLERRARTWMQSEPVLWPSEQYFPESASLAAQLSGIGVPKNLSAEATQLGLMLSIHHGKLWWVWFQRARDLPEVPRLLMLGLNTIRHPWVRVAGRAAYLLQCVERETITKVAEEFFATNPLPDRGLLDATFEGTVSKWIRRAMDTATEVEFGKLAELHHEIIRAEGSLGCEQRRRADGPH